MQESFLTDLPDEISTPKRKNNPHLLRHNILINTKNLILSEGIIYVSMQKVADMAGVSKGGLFHHFNSKDELIEGVFELFIAQINTAILTHIQQYGETKFGTFSRAYIHALCDNDEVGLNSDWAGLIRAMTADERLHGLWQDWLSHKLIQYQSTDSDPRLSAIRCAIDGAWLNGLRGERLVVVRDYLFGLIDDIAQ